MKRREIFISNGENIPHNFILIKPVIDDIIIESITTLSAKGEIVEIVDNPIEISSMISIRYPLIVSRKLRIVIRHEMAGIISLDKILSIKAGLENYSTNGRFSSAQEELSFNEKVIVSYDIENVLDSYIQATLKLSTIDKYNNIIYSASVPLSMNDNGEMVNYANSGSRIKLDYIPDPDSIKVIVDNQEIDEYQLVEEYIVIDIPNGINVYVVYKPYFFGTSRAHKINENVEIDSAYGIILEDKYCEKIVYSVVLEVFNTSMTSTNHTPIIKSIGVFSTGK